MEKLDSTNGILRDCEREESALHALFQSSKRWRQAPMVTSDGPSAPALSAKNSSDDNIVDTATRSQKKLRHPKPSLMKSG